MPSLTNAARAQVIVVVNSIFALIATFGVNMADSKEGAITVAINALLGLWVALTYKKSPKRIPDE